MKLSLFFILFFLSLPAWSDISLGELGISEVKEETQVLTKKESVERKHKLQTHEVLGLTTFGLMTATMLTGNSALSSNTHMYLGMATAATYFASAYFSLTAPKPMGVVDKGRIKWHKGLAWVHFPLMILVPYLGYQYKKHEEDGVKHSSLEKQHSTFAGLLYGTFAISAALMVVEF